MTLEEYFSYAIQEYSKLELLTQEEITEKAKAFADMAIASDEE